MKIDAKKRYIIVPKNGNNGCAVYGQDLPHIAQDIKSKEGGYTLNESVTTIQENYILRLSPTN